MKNKLSFNILDYTKKDSFFFDVTKFLLLIYKIFDYNELKYEEEDLAIINEEINECNRIKNDTKEDKKNFLIIPEFYESLKSMILVNKMNSSYAENIKSIISEINIKEGLSLRKIKSEYEEKFKMQISIATISRVMKNHLNLRYLKTTIKTKKLLKENYMFMSFLFLKGISRALNLKLNLIYIDESGFSLENNNFRMWRNRADDLCIGSDKNIKKRLNLILASNKEEIIHYYITEENVDENEFLLFLKGIEGKTNKNKKDCILIIDNASYHKTEKIIDFVLKNKLKVLTIVPYQSKFNMSELIFRYIKNRTYKRIFESYKEIKLEIEKILQSEELKRSLNNLFKETLIKYVNYEEENKNIDLNYLYDKMNY